ncbi:TPA: hypothetical protein HA278_07420, partial [Candidatus Woesearchaeota archaeon]|nr:hypothetical protein [Candidatus Woesearchaeota archaeon]
MVIKQNGLLCITSTNGRGTGFAFKVKDLDMQSGGPNVAVLNIDDAKKLDLHSSDRILVRNGGGEVPCILNVAESSTAVPPGKIGLYEEVLDALHVKKNHRVTVHLTGKPESVKHIRAKLLGKELTY